MAKTRPTAAALIPLTVRRIVDGDTIVADFHLPYGTTLSGEMTRAADYDAFETRRGRHTTEGEVILGKEAAAHLAKILDGRLVMAKIRGRGRRDVFGRLLASWWTYEDGDLTSVAEQMRDYHKPPPF